MNHILLLSDILLIYCLFLTPYKNKIDKIVIGRVATVKAHVSEWVVGFLVKYETDAVVDMMKWVTCVDDQVSS